MLERTGEISIGFGNEAKIIFGRSKTDMPKICTENWKASVQILAFRNPTVEDIDCECMPEKQLT
jgi:hypothetical protein